MDIYSTYEFKKIHECNLYFVTNVNKLLNKFE